MDYTNVFLVLLNYVASSQTIRKRDNDPLHQTDFKNLIFDVLNVADTYTSPKLRPLSPRELVV